MKKDINFKGCVAFMLLLTMLTTACHRHSSDDGANIYPTKVTQTFPAQNSVCVSGTVISVTASTIMFTWNASDNTDIYELDIKNLLTNAVITISSTTPQATATLERNTPYSWYVISRSKTYTQTMQSDTWKFYNAGVGVTSYSPFPAAITTPAYGQTVIATNGTVNLNWIGSDVDNDIVAYDVYCSTSTTPALLKASVTDMFLNNVSVTSGATYYWKIITKDSKGNTSDSGTFQFTVR